MPSIKFLFVILMILASSFGITATTLGAVDDQPAPCPPNVAVPPGGDVPTAPRQPLPGSPAIPLGLVIPPQGECESEAPSNPVESLILNESDDSSSDGERVRRSLPSY